MSEIYLKGEKLVLRHRVKIRYQWHPLRCSSTHFSFDGAWDSSCSYVNDTLLEFSYFYCIQILFKQHLHVTGFFFFFFFTNGWKSIENADYISCGTYTYLANEQISRDAINVVLKILKHQCTPCFFVNRERLSFQCIECDLHFFVQN